MSGRSGTKNARYPTVARVLVDCLAWALALAFANLVRYDFVLSRVDLPGLGAAIALAWCGQLAGGWGWGLYRGRWRSGSIDEVAAIVRTTTFTTLVLVVAAVSTVPRPVPLSTTFAAGVTAVALISGSRYVARVARERRRRPTGPDSERLLVLGAGDGGTQAISVMMRNPASPYLPVALLDDDPARRNLRILGVPVVGTRHDMAAAARTHRASTLLIAIPSAGAAVIAELEALATAAGLSVKVLPPVKELFGSRIAVSDIRDVTPGDLLGRVEVQTDVGSIAGYLTGRRVLVTGAGGSIGSELCRQIHCLGPAELMMVDRDESALHAVQLSLDGKGLLDSPALVLLDIRDRERLTELFVRRRPEVVFHAAALKHLPLLELHPSEAVKTNVCATLDLLEIACRAGVERFVNVSTDKAADPQSVLGHSKRICERLTAHFARLGSGTYLSVRFGNVLGSRGSVLTAFHAQLGSGGPLTVTHPDVTRYFMTVEEAVQLVIQAGAIGQDGEVLVLDMGEPVRILDVARRLAATAERPVEIVYTGLRPGEKLHEARLAPDEVDRRPVHPLISHIDVAPLHPDRARQLRAYSERAAIVSGLAALSREPASAHPALPVA